MTALIISAPHILDFSNSEDSIAQASGSQRIYKLSCDGSSHYCPQQKIIKRSLHLNPSVDPVICFTCKTLMKNYSSKRTSNLYLNSFAKDNAELKKEIIKVENVFSENSSSATISKRDFETKMLLHFSEFHIKTLYSFLKTHLLISRVERVPVKLTKLNLIEMVKYFYVTNKIIANYDIKEVYVYNGRMPRFAGAKLAAEKNDNVTIRFYESTIFDLTSYVLTENPICHIGSFSKELKRYKIKNPDKEERDDGYIHVGKRFEGISSGYLPAFHKDRKKNITLMPSTLGNDSVISIFTGGEFETMPIPENKMLLGVDILGSLKTLFEEDLIPKKASIIIRVHPNLKGKDYSYQKKIKCLVQKFDKDFNITFYSAESKVDSYNIIKRSDKVITFGSTINLEAALLRIPSVSLGPSFHEKFYVSSYPKNKGQVKDFLISSISKAKLDQFESNAISYFSTMSAFKRKNKSPTISQTINSILTKKLMYNLARVFRVLKLISINGFR